MRRVLALTLVLVAICPQAGFAGLLEPLPAPASLPPYVTPLAVLDDVLHLPAGEAPIVGPAQVCYGPAAHLRLTMALQLAPALSDERARISWLYGWRDAHEADAPAFDEEHAARLKAEATAHALDARLQAAARSESLSWWRDLVIGLGIFGLGTTAGFLWGMQ